MSRHNKERRRVRAKKKAAMLAKGIRPIGKAKDTTRVIYKDTEAGPSRHRETKHNPPWFFTPNEVLATTPNIL